MNIQQNCVVALHYTLTNDRGEELDSSAGNDPLEYLHGGMGIIPGLEQELSGKAVGDKFVVVIQPEDAYGESKPELISIVPRKQFGDALEISPGMQLQGQRPDGEAQLATVLAVDDENVTLNANHPLAGQVLHFDVSIERVRAATDEEIAQGHPA